MPIGRDVSQMPTMDAFPPKLKRMTEKVMQRGGITIRNVDMKHLAKKSTGIIPVYDAAWSKNWGIIPMTDAEFHHLAHGLKDGAGS